MKELTENIKKAAILVAALPYIQAFRNKTVVVKYGGSIGPGDSDNDTILQDIVFMEHVGMNPVIVHGGGLAIDKRLKERNIETRRVNGLRITDGDTMQVVEETLFGEVNVAIVTELERLGGRAVGVSAKDAGVMHVRKHSGRDSNGDVVDIGYVGEVDYIDATPINELITDGVIPVIAPIGLGEDKKSYNVNADTAAGEIAVGLCAEKLVFLTDVIGVMRNPSDDSSLLSTIQVDEVESLIKDRIIDGGMIPKAKACVQSVRAGVQKTHIVDGRIPHSMLLEFLTDEGIGTQIVQ